MWNCLYIYILHLLTSGFQTFFSERDGFDIALDCKIHSMNLVQSPGRSLKLIFTQVHKSDSLIFCNFFRSSSLDSLSISFLGPEVRLINTWQSGLSPQVTPVAMVRWFRSNFPSHLTDMPCQDPRKRFWPVWFPRLTNHHIRWAQERRTGSAPP